jgi:hypothetical protein
MQLSKQCKWLIDANKHKHTPNYYTIYHDFALSYMNINELETLSFYDLNIIEYNEKIKII